MKQILVVGAGREGKGYLGNVFAEGGWKVSFLDKDPAVIDALKTGRYEVMEYRAEDRRCRIVEGYNAYIEDEKYECRNAALNADVITLCLYPKDISEAVHYLLPLLRERAQTLPEKKLTIFPCTNEGGLIPVIDRQLREGLGEKGNAWYENQVILTDTVVRRSVGAESSSSLKLEAGVVCPMLVGAPIFADLTGVPWMQTCNENMELLKELKVHTINTEHATCAYVGYYLGYDTIDDARTNPKIQKICKGVLDEAVPVLAKVYHVSEESLWELAVFPASKDAFHDPITRVAFDPLRKLARHDRLTANACLCLENGVDPVNLIQAMTCGMAYDAPSDPAAQTIQKWILEMGIERATAKVTGLPAEHELIQRVSQAWKKLKEDAN